MYLHFDRTHIWHIFTLCMPIVVFVVVVGSSGGGGGAVTVAVVFDTL